MNIQPELLKLNIDPLKKLILGLIIDTPLVVVQMAGGCDKTCDEMRLELGLTSKVIRAEVEELIAIGYITCQKGDGQRITNVTERLKELLRNH
jgi:hypothetical protein